MAPWRWRHLGRPSYGKSLARWTGVSTTDASTRQLRPCVSGPFMIFTETRLQGSFIIDLEPHADPRGFFARAFCQREFADHGLKPVIAQANIGFNRTKGTLRGMHF